MIEVAARNSNCGINQRFWPKAMGLANRRKPLQSKG